jgi:hypothetical protein
MEIIPVAKDLSRGWPALQQQSFDMFKKNAGLGNSICSARGRAWPERALVICEKDSYPSNSY